MKQAEAYLRAVRRGLADAPEDDRERLMRRLTEAVSAYLEEDPEAGEADIIKAFGTPEDCAAELLAECDPSRVEAVRQKRRRRLYAVIAALAAAALLLALAVVWGTRAQSGGPDIPAADSAYHGEQHSGHDSGHH